MPHGTGCEKRSLSRETLNSAAVWLIGCAMSEIRGENRLPILRHVLQHVLFLHGPGNGKNETIRDACRHTIEKLIPIWTRGGVPTLCVKDATDNLMTVYKEWIELKRSKNRPTSARREVYC